MRHRQELNSELGMSLIVIVVAIAVSSIVGYFLNQYLVNQFKLQKHVELTSDVQNLSIYALRRMNCAGTFPSQLQPCGYGRGVAVASNDPAEGIFIKAANLNAPLPRNMYSNVGAFSLRARCVVDPYAGSPYGFKLLIEYAVLQNNGQAKNDSLTKKALVWKDLFDGLPTPCVVQ